MRSSSPLAVALVGALVSVLLLGGCARDAGEVVRSGPAAASQEAVGNQGQPVAVDLPAPLARCTNAPAGWGLREARQRGVPELARHRVDPSNGPVVGYLDSFTAVCGQTISVHLSSFHRLRDVRLRALRIGDYQGRGARLVWQSGVLTARGQPQGVPTGPDRVIAERWPVAATIPINASWPPGMYLIEIAPVGGGKSSFIPLAVRTSGVHSPYIVVLSDLTWAAYNIYGGRSLYSGPGNTDTRRVANRSYVASTDRPLQGSGLSQVFSMNIPLIRFLSRNNIAYDLTTDSSLDATPSQISGQQTVLIDGHSEYWTKRMYDAALQARDAGTNFAFLGANEIYWQGRIERDRSGRASALTVYRDSKLDRLAKTDPSTTTVQWYHLRNPAAFVGVGMSVIGVRGDYVVNTAPGWLFAGTNLRQGSILELAYGNEVDAQEPPGHSPANLQVVLHGVAVPAGRTKPFPVTAAYYDAPSGAGVFAAGTTYWVCALDSTCPVGATPPATSVAIQQITLNLIRAFAVARAGQLHPSIATPYLSPTQLASQLPLGSPDGSSETQHPNNLPARQ